jgi:hypothetical protein
LNEGSEGTSHLGTSGVSTERKTEARREVGRKGAMTAFEIGVVYRKGGRLFLAVAERTLVTFKDGEPQEVRPQARYEMVRSISCEDLCQRWGITLDRLDQVTAKYLAPATEGLKTRPRGSRRPRIADETAWRDMRLIRLLAG